MGSEQREQREKMLSRLLEDDVLKDDDTEDACADPSDCYWGETLTFDGDVCDRCGVTSNGRGGFYPLDPPETDGGANPSALS